MRRLAALVLASVLVATSAVGSLLHVHEYARHDHPEHRHGPAWHQHESPESAELDHVRHGLDRHEQRASDHPSPAVESCEPGQHVTPIRLTCTDSCRVQVVVREGPRPAPFAPAAPRHSASPVADVRVHGPPLDSRFSPRAPPLTHPA